MTIVQRYKKVPLLFKLLVAMVLGAIIGAVFGERILFIKMFGQVFLDLLKMAALPLIVVNLIAGISSLDDPKILGRVGFRIMVYFMATTAIAIILGILVGYIFKPGVGFQLEGTYEGVVETVPSIGESLLGLIPSNIFAALSAGRFDQIVVFSAFVGIALLFLPVETKNSLNGLFNNLSALFNRMIGIIMGYAPIGVMALMACTVGTYGKMLAGFLAKYLAASYFAILVHIAFYCILLVVFTKQSPLKFLKKAMPLIITALSTSSSLASVPVSMECAEDMKISPSISSFVIPLGAQINKDGNGIMLALTFLFAAQSVNAPLSIGVLVRVVLIALLLTTGAGGVPGGGIVTIAIVIDAFGMPLEVVGIISGIFALIDMGFTMMNCLGTLVGAKIVDDSEKKRELSLEKTTI